MPALRRRARQDMIAPIRAILALELEQRVVEIMTAIVKVRIVKRQTDRDHLRGLLAALDHFEKSYSPPGIVGLDLAKLREIARDAVGDDKEKPPPA